MTRTREYGNEKRLQRKSQGKRKEDWRIIRGVGTFVLPLHPKSKHSDCPMSAAASSDQKQTQDRSSLHESLPR